MSCRARLAAIPDGFVRHTPIGRGAIIRMAAPAAERECHANCAISREKASARGCREASRQRSIATKARSDRAVSVSCTWGVSAIKESAMPNKLEFAALVAVVAALAGECARPTWRNGF
jgi:hypothetical protein